MRAGHRRDALPLLAFVFALSTGLATACGDEFAVVGGECAPGYARCGTHGCCPVSDGPALDAGGGLPARAGGDAGVPGSGDAGSGSVTPKSAPDSGVVTTTGGAEAGTSESGSGESSSPEAGEPDADVGSDAGEVADAGPAPEAGPACAPPLVDCGGQCIDTTSDPDNCGGCGNVCPSLICQASTCVGATRGGIVFVGHDYATTPPGTSQAHVLANAVLFPQSEPLNVLSYERYAMPGAVARARTIVADAAQSAGRTIAITSSVTDADVPGSLTFDRYGVLLVHDQVSAAPGALAALGASWQPTLTTFVQQGGVVVVLDGGTGTGEMPEFATATGLLAVTAQSSVVPGTFLDVVASGDAVGIGVLSPYSAGASSVSLTTEAASAQVAYVVVDPGDAGGGAPVVVHKSF